MIQDPKVQEILKGGTTQFLTPWQKVERVLAWVCLGAVAVLAVGLFIVNAVANQANTASRRASLSVQASCGFWHDLALLPTTPQTTVTGFRIIADSYVAYSGLNCKVHTGPLPAPSQSVTAQIPAILRAQVLSSVR